MLGAAKFVCFSRLVFGLAWFDLFIRLALGVVGFGVMSGRFSARPVEVAPGPVVLLPRFWNVPLWVGVVWRVVE